MHFLNIISILIGLVQGRGLLGRLSATKLFIPGDKELVLACLGNLLKVRAIPEGKLLEVKSQLRRGGKVYCGDVNGPRAGDLVRGNLLQDRNLDSTLEILTPNRNKKGIFIIIKRTFDPTPKGAGGLVSAIDLRKPSRGRAEVPEVPEIPSEEIEPIVPSKPEIDEPILEKPEPVDYSSEDEGEGSEDSYSSGDDSDYESDHDYHHHHHGGRHRDGRGRRHGGRHGDRHGNHHGGRYGGRYGRGYNY